MIVDAMSYKGQQGIYIM